jgi:hypothetical protein
MIKCIASAQAAVTGIIWQWIRIMILFTLLDLS